MLRWILFAFVVAIGIETGAGLFTSVVVFPTWAASPEVVIGWKPTMPYFMEEGWFFQFSSSITTLLALVVGAMYKRFPANVRRWVLGSAAIFFLMAVATMVYYVPEQFRMHGDAGARLPREELAMMLDRFIALNWIRQVALVVAFTFAIHALGLMYRSLVPRNADHA
jgi:hypothetical protein